MQKITFRADEALLKQARTAARREGKTLNHLFREWLRQFTASARREREFHLLMSTLRHVSAGRHFSRDEMNER